MVDGKLKFTVTKYFNGYPSYDKSTPFEHSALDNDWHMITLTSDYPKLPMPLLQVNSILMVNT